MITQNNPRICRACGSLIHSHTPEALKYCRRVEDKQRQTIGRLAFSQCCQVNPGNPQAVAESIKDMYEALKELVSIFNHPAKSVTYKEVKRAETILAKAESKGG